MIDRYQRPQLKKIWSEKSKFDAYLKVELAASYAWMNLGLFDQATYDKLSKATFKIKEILEIEKETKHDVIAFTKSCKLSLGEEKKYLHYGMTSTDVVDSAYGVLLKKVNRILKKDILDFMAVLKAKAFLYQHTPIMGRTHGMHAEITSFGLKFALWYEDFKRLYKGFLDAAKGVEVCKLSGAVGNYAANTPDIEKIASKKLGLTPSNISTQTLQRDRHAKYIFQLSLITAEIEKIAIEIRHLSRSEVHEVSEFFDKNQKGSSAMPHKKNPISSENVTGVSRLLKGYVTASLDNIPLWHERDISHSSVERVVLQDATSLVDYALTRYKNTLDKLIVYKEQMLKNIDITHGASFAQHVLHALINKGFDRDEAYDQVQRLAYIAIEEGHAFKDLILNEKAFKNVLSKADLDQIFDVNFYIRHTDYIYQKVFG